MGVGLSLFAAGRVETDLIRFDITSSGRLWHFDGSSWKDDGIHTEVVFGLSPSDIFAASLVDTGAVYRKQGTGWTELTRLAGDEPFRAIYAVPGPFLIAACEHGVATWNGVTWGEWQFNSFEYIEGVWADTIAGQQLHAVPGPERERQHLLVGRVLAGPFRWSGVVGRLFPR